MKTIVTVDKEDIERAKKVSVLVGCSIRKDGDFSSFLRWMLPKVTKELLAKYRKKV
jgi:hypothetical protein